MSDNLNEVCLECGGVKKVNRRSLFQLRLYWGMLGKVVDNQNVIVFPTVQHLHEAIKGALGYVHAYYDKNGNVAGYTLDSISIQSMDAPSFNEYMDKAVTFVCNGIIPNLKDEKVKNELYDMLQIYRG